VRIGFILDPHERGRVAGDLEFLRRDERDRLAAIDDLVVVESRKGEPGGATSSCQLELSQAVRGRFSCVKTFSTPGTASAAVMSIDLIRPFAMALDTT
jgi:hypothetical protein